MSDREQLRQLGAEINGVIDKLSGPVAVVLAKVEGCEQPLIHHYEYASRVMAVVAPVLAEKMYALSRAVADVDRQDRIACARHEVAQRLRGKLAVALSAAETARRERDDARFELHKIRNQDLAGINLECASEWCAHVAIDLAELAEHGKRCHPAASPAPGGVDTPGWNAEFKALGDDDEVTW